METLQQCKKIWTSIVRKNQIENDRSRKNVVWRHAFSVACTEHTYLSYEKIAAIMKRDHSTIVHTLKQHPINYSQDTEYRTAYNLIAELFDQEFKEAFISQSRQLERVARRSTSELAIEKMKQNYRKGIERNQTKYENQIETQKEELRILRAHSRRQKTRIQELELEIKRIKNLI